MKIGRTAVDKLQQLAVKFPFVTITGPRQSGKSTLAETAFPDFRQVSLEDLDNREFALKDPRGFIATYPSKTIIDEVQRVPSILSYLQTHADKSREMGMYVLTGSQNFELMEAIDQSLAGRTALLTLLPLSHEEMGQAGILPENVDAEIFYGSYPALYDRGIHPVDYFPSYIKSYLEKDVRQMKAIEDLSRFRKLVRLCAGRIGQILNKSSLAVECGVTSPTVDSWLSVLEESYIVYFLRPDYRNFSKRLVKSPKLYFYDTGLACSLLDIKSPEQVSTHYLRGGLFENMVVNEILKRSLNRGIDPALSFWRDSAGHEVDLIVTAGDIQHAYEIKSGATFSTDYFKGLDYWAGLSGVSPSRRSVIYAGETPLMTSSGEVLSWRNM